MTDNLGREELMLALKVAAAIDRDAPASDQVSRRQAEEIAKEVGITPAQFREALAQARSLQLDSGKLLGPSSSMSVEASVMREVTSRDAARAIAEGQAGLPQMSPKPVEVAPGVWRSSSSRTLLQISSDPSGTNLSAAANRGLLKASTIMGATGVGGFVGAQLGTLVTVVLTGDVSSTVALGLALGALGGIASGFASGVVLWRSSARLMQTRLHRAVDRMRGTLEGEA